MNRRSFLSMFARAGVLAATNPVHFIAPIGGWKSDDGNLYGNYGNLHRNRFERGETLWLLPADMPLRTDLPSFEELLKLYESVKTKPDRIWIGHGWIE